MEQETVNIDGVDTTLKARGRHDACVLPRAVPIVEAMAAMTILDYYLLDKTTQALISINMSIYPCANTCTKNLSGYWHIG